jgi:hypothetical protein
MRAPGANGRSRSDSVLQFATGFRVCSLQHLKSVIDQVSIDRVGLYATADAVFGFQH